MGEQWRADLGGERRGVDNAARALADEMPSHDLVGQEYATGIDGEIKIPVRIGKLESALHGRDASVGDADIAATQKLERPAERALDRGARAHVDLDCDGVFADLLRRSLCRLAIDISDRDFHAASRERVRNGAADALSAAGYERALAVELRIGRTVCRHCTSTRARAEPYQQNRRPRRRFLFDNLAVGVRLPRRDDPLLSGNQSSAARLRNSCMVFDFFGDKKKVVIAMAHIGALPGSPLYDANGGVNKLIEGVLKDVDALQTGGVDALMFGNENDRPYVLKAPPEGTAAMTAGSQAVT